MLIGVAAFAQTPAPSKAPAAKPRKANELTLAGLRPGRDKAAKAIQLFGKPDFRSADKQSLVWGFAGIDGAYYLNLDIDKTDVVQFIRVSQGDGPSGVIVPRHSPFAIRTWESGRGLAVGTTGSRVVQLYGEPDSRSPSTRAGRKLELLYYAFDWAGADVPQVMEVLCTVEDDGKPGRVVDITLAAPSL
jgi:hypothetical protein